MTVMYFTPQSTTVQNSGLDSARILTMYGHTLLPPPLQRDVTILDIDCTDRQRVVTTEYDIDVALMVWQRKSEGYCHLGVPTGIKVNNTSEYKIAQN
ncbi:hypothetical protein J6590_096529 [Homalodisca vitripennis]|nr:hypothetical protein J6590_096529 [Homalodisca vitripennis]